MDQRPNEDHRAGSWLPEVFQRRGTVTSQTVLADERAALLPKPDDEDETYDLEDGSKTTYELVVREFWILLKGSIPVILAYTLQNSLQTFSVLIVGRLSPEALATAAFSYMFAMASAWLIALGGTTAIDTLASSAFTGSKNPHDLGVILQRSFVVLTLFYIPIAILWIFSEPVFKALGQEAYLARDAARFLTVLVPGGLGYIFFEAVKKYLQAQGINLILE